MKKFYQWGFAMLLIGFCKVGAIGQLNCIDSISVELGLFTGMATISVDDVVEGAIPSETVISKGDFTCDDVGMALSITATSGSDVCFSIVSVLDITPPVAVADQNIELVLPQGSNLIVLSPDLVDDGSYDLCSDVTLSVSPSILDCSYAGQIIDVTLNVVDASGNQNSAISSVNVKGAFPSPLVCLADFEISIVDEFQVTLGLIANGFNDCAERTFILEDENENEVLDGILTIADIGKTFTATVTQVDDNATCSTIITAVELVDCVPFKICDTKCNDAALGDCDSGHTDSDNGEWPCDLSFPGAYPGFEEISPDALMLNFGVAENDARPLVIEESCHTTSMAFQDEISYIENGVKIIRTWTILEWHTFYSVSYAQEIVFSGGGPELIWNICDTKSNETEVGDCESGHTDSDDVEWPGDVIAIDHRISPDELLLITEYPESETRPILVNNEDYYRVSYVDAVLSAGPANSLVGRVWTIQSTQSSELSAQYVQRILIPAIDNAANKVFVTTHGGRPMPGVSVDSTLTDEKGVAVVKGDDPLMISYVDDPSLGIDILDMVLLKRIILADIPFTEFPYVAMDINEDGKISTLDILKLQKLYTGTYDPPGDEWGWRFFFRTDPFINVKGDVVSYKKGDLDDSAPLAGVAIPDPDAMLILEDQILNEGENYTIALSLDSEYTIYGGQFFYDIDLSEIEIEDVNSSQLNIGWRITEENDLTMFFSDGETVEVAGNVDFITIKFKALKNTTLNEALGLSTEKETFLVDENLEKVHLGQVVDGVITSGLLDIAQGKDIAITPNPASDWISVTGDFTNELTIEIFNTSGEKVSISKQAKIDISQLPKGIYLLHGTDGVKFFKGKFTKL